MEIKSKKEFYSKWQMGLLGNRPRTWSNYKDLENSGYRGSVTIRTIGAAGSKTVYRVPQDIVPDYLKSWKGTPTFNESAPDEVLTIQGELQRSEAGLELYYDCTPNTPMNVARKSFKRATGVAAKAILDSYLWPNSRADVDEFLDLYPDAVVEFSAYDRAVGDQLRRNTLIWEVRSY